MTSIIGVNSNGFAGAIQALPFIPPTPLPPIPIPPSPPAPDAPSNITIPATCGVMSLLGTGSAFATSILEDVALLQANMSAAVASILSLPDLVIGIVLSDIEALAANLSFIVTSIVAGFLSHITAQFTNLINNLSMAVGQAAAQAGLTNSGCGLPSLGPNFGGGGGTASRAAPGRCRAGRGR